MLGPKRGQKIHGCDRPLLDVFSSAENGSHLKNQKKFIIIEINFVIILSRYAKLCKLLEALLASQLKLCRST